MVLTDIGVTYTKCTKCSSCSCIYAYFVGNVNSLEKLKSLISKTCGKCKSGLKIERMKAKIVTKGLK